MMHFKTLDTMSPSQKEQIKLAYLTSQFFLPPEILFDTEVSAERISVLCGTDAMEYLSDMATLPDYTINGDFPLHLISAADQVAISERRYKPTGQRFIVYKLWSPFNPSHRKEKQS